jgi:hypothetical protein
MRVLPHHPHERLRLAIFMALFALTFGVHSAVTKASSIPAGSDLVAVGEKQSDMSERETRTSLPRKGQDFPKRSKSAELSWDER